MALTDIKVSWQLVQKIKTIDTKPSVTEKGAKEKLNGLTMNSV